MNREGRVPFSIHFVFVFHIIKVCYNDSEHFPYLQIKWKMKKFSRSGNEGMLKIHEIREIIKLIDQSGITHFELDNEGAKLKIKKEPVVQAVQTTVVSEPVSITPVAPVVHEQPKETPAPTVVNQEPVKEVTTIEVEENLHKITSPMVGTFYAAPNPEAKPFVSVGDKVDKNTVVCIIEAMKLFNEIEAEVKGTIVKILVENGQLVEYGQPLFLVKLD